MSPLGLGRVKSQLQPSGMFPHTSAVPLNSGRDFANPS
jgi:hypothetical protein